MKAGEKACPRCKATIKKAAHLCKHCGHRFPEQEIKPALPQQEHQGDMDKGWVGVVVVLVALVALAKAFSPNGDGNGGSVSSQPSSKAERPPIAADAISSYAEADRKHYPKLFAQLGDRVFEVEDLGRKAAVLAIQTNKCDRVIYVDVSERSTRDDLQFFVDCDNETRVRVSEKEINAGLVSDVETRSQRMSRVAANMAQYDLLIAQAKDTVRASLRDPSSAEFGPAAVSTKNGTVVCGTVNARNGFGGMTGQQSYIAFGNGIVTQQDTGFAAQWEKHCS